MELSVLVSSDIGIFLFRHEFRCFFSVYAKYYFDLRSLADANDMSFPAEQLNIERAQKLEALSRLCAQKVSEGVMFTNALKRSSSLDNMANSHRRSVAILS